MFGLNQIIWSTDLNDLHAKIVNAWTTKTTTHLTHFDKSFNHLLLDSVEHFILTCPMLHAYANVVNTTFVWCSHWWYPRCVSTNFGNSRNRKKNIFDCFFFTRLLNWLKITKWLKIKLIKNHKMLRLQHILKLIPFITMSTLLTHKSTISKLSGEHLNTKSVKFSFMMNLSKN